ncbi:tyrosine-protein phosphatase non-receptor type 9 isoform X2 [Daktulosphaira vitifoliae]|uniref:tyrosine-protein phosphatase non-receptor type 9 isoform X2 n=1 Tax=Daktulosphaira vitifoliae TaxID=58002 RepID=UPI0021A9F758|nr:tyrosine-protein phosphatase non-receptor type 9 isoform X2 [Daktulosphaira vitifoliae]
MENGTLNNEQKKALAEFIEVVNRMRKVQNKPLISQSTAIKFLCARKFDVARSIILHEQHEETRLREGLFNFSCAVEPLKSELQTQKFTILPTRDSTGAAIAIFTARYHTPNFSSHQTTLQGIVYQLDIALENIKTQRCGLVFIYDMSDSKYANFDYDLSQKILTLLKGGYPAKLKKVLIVTAPLWFKAPFKILRLFVREKLRDRVFTISLPQLTQYIPRESLPKHLGGTIDIDHNKWLTYCLNYMTNSEKYGSSDMSEHICNSNNTKKEVDPDPKVNNVIGENNIERSAIVKNNLSSGWTCNTANSRESSPMPTSSVSSGFSDDDSLRCDSSQSLTISQFIDHVLKKKRTGLMKEYEEIKTRSPDGTFTASRVRANLLKNRYTDVLCYDHTRVLLAQSDNDPLSDYIHANFVDGYKQKNAFISTQGPLPHTCADFWRMIWEQQVLVIVMTTKVFECGKVKCEQYWPPEESSEDQMYHNFKISTNSVNKFDNYVVTRLEITYTNTNEVRQVSHFQFNSWPDFGVPHSAVAMLDFLGKVRKCQSSMLQVLGDKWAGHQKGPPIVVHCSAGIGRTGTFCTLDICINRLEDTNTVDIKSSVERIRSQRAYSIQTAEQYVFCHLALIEYALARGFISTPPDLSELNSLDDSD